VGVLVKSDDPEDHKKAKAILKQLEPTAELEESDDKPEPKPKDGDKDKDKEEEKKAAIEESRELFTLVGIKPSQRLLESVARMPRMSDRLAFLNEIKGTGLAAAGNKPPPGAPRGATGSAALLEGQQKVTYDDLAKVNLM
jgi:hypothetical protein